MVVQKEKVVIVMKKVIGILCLSLVVFSAGIVIAYYHTSSLGYDNANLISFRTDSVQIMDFDIYYEDVKEIWTSLQEAAPKNYTTI